MKTYVAMQLKNAFKNHFFSCLRIDPEKPSQSTSEQVNVQLTGSKLDDWLYRFCLCFVFRVMLVAANGCFNLQGNFDQLYEFVHSLTCHEFLKVYNADHLRVRLGSAL